MRPRGSPQVLEKRRKRAVELLGQGLSLREVARRVEASSSAVVAWRDAYEERGKAGLAPKPVPGRPRKLPGKKLRHLWKVLLDGALAYGYPNDLWTLERIARVIEKEFGVAYHPSHVWKILRSSGWSCQVPERRAVQRDEDAIEHWDRREWPAIKKSRRTGCPSRFPGREWVFAGSYAGAHLGT
jgi:transposase